MIISQRTLAKGRYHVLQSNVLILSKNAYTKQV